MFKRLAAFFFVVALPLAGQTILVHAHRGGRAARPENSIPAFEFAIQRWSASSSPLILRGSLCDCRDFISSEVETQEGRLGVFVVVGFYGFDDVFAEGFGRSRRLTPA